MNIFVKKMEPWHYYLNEMHDKWTFLAAWPPNQKLQLGDVGTLRSNVFERISSLTKLGIDYDNDIITGAAEDELFQSAGQVNIYCKFDASGIPPTLPFAKLGADVVVSFKKENSVFYRASKSRICSIADQLTLGNKILEIYRNYRDAILRKQPTGTEWQPEWAVITDLHCVERATIIISNEKNSFIGLQADAGISKIDILNFDCDFTINHVQGIQTNILAEKGLTPLFNVLMLKEEIFKNIATKRYLRAVEPGEPGYDEYKRNLPVMKYEVKDKAENYEPFVEA